MMKEIDRELSNELKRLISVRIDTAKGVREVYEKDWKKNLLYHFGKSFLVTYKDKKGLVDLGEEFQDVNTKERRLIPSNLMFSAYTNILGRLMNIPHDYICIPTTTQSVDENSAIIGEKILNAVVSPKIRTIKNELLFWIIWTNTSVLKLYYDRKTKIEFPRFTNKNSGVPLLRGDLGLTTDRELQVGQLSEDKKLLWWELNATGEKQWNTLYDGDIALSLLSPIEYFVDPLAKSNSLKSQDRPRWFIHQKVVSEEWLEMNDIDLADVKFDSSPADAMTQLLCETRKQNIPSSGEKYAIYQEYWALPSRKYPAGLYVRMIGDKVFEINDLPEPFLSKEILPFISISDTLHPYGWYTHTLLDKIRPLHTLHSVVLTKLCENIEKTGLLGVGIPGGETLEKKNIQDDLIDSVYTTQGTGQMQPFTIDRIPMVLIRLIDVIYRDVETIFLHDIRYPEKDRPLGETMAILEQDENRLYGLKESIVRAFEDIGELAIKMMQIYYPPKKQLRILGEANEYELYQFNSADIVSNFDIKISMGHLPYFTQSGILSRVVQLKELGLVTEPTEVIRLLNLKELVQSPDYVLDEREALKENAKLLQSKIEITTNEKGEEVVRVLYNNQDLILTVEPWHNHDIHIQTHNRLLKKHGHSLNSFVIQEAIEHIDTHENEKITKTVEMETKLQVAQAILQPPTAPTKTE